MQTAFPHPEIIGSFHQFGPFGIPYQVLRPERETGAGWTVEIEIPETGERLEYSLDAVLNDPEAR
ncbi:hypothetical protein SAMN02949497_4729 [Methylomagnum ishizawai]|uniref:Uncharacterized protein n=1 Tax=Methylomagnum ishizawai TaxID=1760988 RepID=A0A1Y6D3R8_9GAMM|nr:DUF5397 family protein [Methylomagnum ishizawai]SMF97307.1 hypothetical protein SAMN02949497_4729 [Methylomagnum ishizawai]